MVYDKKIFYQEYCHRLLTSPPDLQKKYGAKSSWKNSGAMVIKIKIPEEC